MAGGYGAYYYTYTAWDVIRPQDTPPGYAYFKHLRDFFEATDYWRLEPADGAGERGLLPGRTGPGVRGLPEQSPAVFAEARGLAESLKAEWFHPFTGKRVGAEHWPTGSPCWSRQPGGVTGRWRCM